MNLNEYLEKNAIHRGRFCKKIGICMSTLYRIFQGGDITLGLAKRIVEETKGQVSYEQLAKLEHIELPPRKERKKK